jgi:hypothetical protein
MQNLVKPGKKWLKSFYMEFNNHAGYLNKEELVYLYKLGLNGKAAAKLLNEKFGLSIEFKGFVNRCDIPSGVKHRYYLPRNHDYKTSELMDKIERITENGGNTQHIYSAVSKYAKINNLIIV